MPSPPSNGSRRRDNDPPTLILTSLAGGPKHGHALLKDIEAFAGVTLGPGALYGAITRLEERGLIASLASDDRRRPYQITAQGSEVLAEALAHMRALVEVGQSRLNVIPTPAGEVGMSDRQGDDRRLRWYPASWRARYGDELSDLLSDEYGARLPFSVRRGLLTGGLVQRFRESGLAGEARPPVERVRAGALVVLAAWSAFVVGGANFAKLSEHFDQALPHGASAHHVPDLAYTVLQDAAGLAGLLVLAGALLALPSFVRFLRGGGWPAVRRHVYGALVSTGITAGLTVPLLMWAHHLTGSQRTHGVHGYNALFVVWAGCIVVTLAWWTVVGVAAARRITLSPPTLAAEATLAALVAAAMVLMLGATAVWWATMAPHASRFLSASPAGASNSSLDGWLVGTVALMTLAVVAALGGVVRVVRTWPHLHPG